MKKANLLSIVMCAILIMFECTPTYAAYDNPSYLDNTEATPTDCIDVTATDTDASETTDAEITIETIDTNLTGASATYNYAKLLQYSLYLYDANMCGTDVGESSLLDWRNDCHTYDKTTYTLSSGATVNVDVTGGYHDAGDHVKFGLPEAYAAFMLEMSYDTHKSAYEAAGQENHLKVINDRFADYLKKSAILDEQGNVAAYVCQVGDGDADHNYWGSPENQPSSGRTIHFTSASNPSTDIVALSSAALTLHYKNYGDTNSLEMAKKLFTYAKNNSKNVDTTAGSFYVSTGWADDYCLAAYLLYSCTGDYAYYNEYNIYKNDEKAKNVYWPLSWDNTAPALAYYSGDYASLSNIMNVGSNTSDGYRVVNSWGSARYNTSMQYTGLLYDEKTGTSTYRSWCENQMNYLLGSNSAGRCYVVGYSSNSVKYPHHRAASGYTGSVQGTTVQAHSLIGALVGGPDQNGNYQDTADNYQYNEVSIDYNATLVAASAAIYSKYISDSNQSIDSNFSVDETSTIYKGVDYSAVFDFEYYINKYPDIKAVYGDDQRGALKHFVEFGMSELRQGSEEFDVNSYYLQYPDLRQVYRKSWVQYYIHYIVCGQKEGRVGTGTTTLQNPVTVYNGVDYSAVYNYNDYMSYHSDIKSIFANDDIGALEHFVMYGMKEGRKAKSTFDPLSYRRANSDLRRLFGYKWDLYYMHYIMYGKREGRIATNVDNIINPITTYMGIDYSAVYDFEYYINKYSDIKKLYGDDDIKALEHFVNYGMIEGRQGNSEFEVQSYKNAHSDLRGVFGYDLKQYYIHYIVAGKKEGRVAIDVTELCGSTTVYQGVNYSAVYNFDEYKKYNSDIDTLFADDDIGAIKHFVEFGMSEGRQASSKFNVNQYKKKNSDLQNAFKDNLTAYYYHYIITGIYEGRASK